MPSTVFAADIGGTKLAVAVVDARGKILARRAEPVDISSPLAPIEQIVRLAQQLASRGSRPHPFRAAGVAVPGLVRSSGTVWAPNLPGWDKIPLARLLARRLRIPVAVESDRNAAVLGEAWRGAARGKRDVVVLLVGTGIGAGILSGGRIIRGAHELSGCAGWMVITEDDRDDFRRVGCLEALAAGPAIARETRRTLERKRRGLLGSLAGETLSAQDAAEAARKGAPVAKEVFERAGVLLGLGVANLISLFDPEVIVLSGGLAGAADLFFDTMKKVALARSQPLAARQVKIVVSRLAGRANLLGVARLALDL